MLQILLFILVSFKSCDCLELKNDIFLDKSNKIKIEKSFVIDGQGNSVICSDTNDLIIAKDKANFVIQDTKLEGVTAENFSFSPSAVFSCGNNTEIVLGKFGSFERALSCFNNFVVSGQTILNLNDLSWELSSKQKIKIAKDAVLTIENGRLVLEDGFNFEIEAGGRLIFSSLEIFLQGSSSSLPFGIVEIRDLVRIRALDQVVLDVHDKTNLVIDDQSSFHVGPNIIFNFNYLNSLNLSKTGVFLLDQSTLKVPDNFCLGSGTLQIRGDSLIDSVTSSKSKMNVASSACLQIENGASLSVGLILNEID